MIPVVWIGGIIVTVATAWQSSAQSKSPEDY